MYLRLIWREAKREIDVATVCFSMYMYAMSYLKVLRYKCRQCALACRDVEVSPAVPFSANGRRALESSHTVTSPRNTSHTSRGKDAEIVAYHNDRRHRVRTAFFPGAPNALFSWLMPCIDSRELGKSANNVILQWTTRWVLGSIVVSRVSRLIYRGN